jgi:hypothetical protein
MCNKEMAVALVLKSEAAGEVPLDNAGNRLCIRDVFLSHPYFQILMQIFKIIGSLVSRDR